MRIITLTTDFGTRDPFVGVMKGVMLSIAPSVTLVDLTHGVDPQDVAQGAFLLADSARFFPTGTVHLAVVDPGVGSSRRPMALQARGQLFVGPDNGLFTDVLAWGEDWQAVQLSHAGFHRADVSSTFHGRDIFAPVAAHLASGVPMMDLGPAITQPVRLAPPTVSVDSLRIVGQVQHVDAFGNALTTVKDSVLTQWLAHRSAASVRVRCGSLQAEGLRRTFADVGEGDPVAYLGSSGVLELAVRNGNAARQGGFQRGSRVELTLE